MSEPAKRPRRSRPPPDPTAMRRSGLNRIGAELGEVIQPPNPPGLGEGMLERAVREDSAHERQIAGLLGQLLARSEENGARIDENREQMNRMDEKLEAISRRLDGVAYQKDIAQFMGREEIERKIEKAVEGVKHDVAGVKADLGGLRKIGWGLVSAALLTAGGVLLKIILAAAHIAT